MNQTGIIILAAGNASRFGSAKQLLSFNNKSLLQHAIDEAATAQLGSVIVVTGANAELISHSLHHHSIQIVYNEHWQQGMASSIVAGLSKMVLNKDINEVIITVCDQPFVTAHLFTELREMKTESGKNIVACAYADTIGTPVLFTQKYFDKLLQLQGDEGAKKLLKLFADDVVSISFPQGIIDIDTKDDFEKLLNHQQHIL